MNHQSNQSSNTSQPKSQSADTVSSTPQSSPSDSSTKSDIQPISKKSSPKKSLKVTIICILTILLLGGLIAVVFVCEYSKPSSMIVSAANNLLSAEHVSVNGNFNITTKGILEHSSININAVMASSDSNFSNTAQIEIDLSDIGITTPINIELSNVIIDGSEIYLKVKGLSDSINRNDVDNVMRTYLDDSIINYAKNIISIIEDRWVVIRIEDIPGNNTAINLLSPVYYCIKDKLTNFSNYSTEISNIYKSNPFVKMESQPDSFYEISVDHNYLAQFINSLVKTNFIQEVASCTGQNIDTDIIYYTADDVASRLSNMPEIFAKFDGFLDYRLIEFKASRDNYNFSVDTDLKFNYDDAVSISAPLNATPIMQIILQIQNIRL